MGYATLHSAFHWEDTEHFLPPRGKNFLITDTLGANGDFLLYHFLTTFLKPTSVNTRVVLVGFSQIFNHYNLVARKLGVNLTAAKTSGRFKFVDGLTGLSSGKIPAPPTTVLPTTPELVLGPLSPENTLESLLGQLEGLVSSEEAGQTCLIYDDVSVLLNLGVSVRELQRFMQASRLLMEKNGGTLVSLVHSDQALLEDPEQESLVKLLMYQTAYILQVKALGSGYSKEVNGQVALIRGPSCRDSRFIPQVLQYKTLDNNVQFFARGFSEGVL
ncbi:hypothetical protein K493DRAFT_245396 [Basidiobolus meristosporus CBS 931.73]|uniref:Elongator complex protein 6 n=1 Tax=Basidiobolus meristosporus CBS 931.73 TaxID=1314790 RepID=A0A1Y1WVW4_9FUNG|nr:hypothetical protein K493DRAFT_245396 [Basidiobolus meristosporus CBS 931.73]|eukprot:ORX77336.1 hypothetical protein K493DRAFT_245396 [Basidiobolus meristosporus CBS 931.73]